jgi:transcriptional regulator with XRE-family HTH domain
MSIGDRIKQIRGRIPQKEFAMTIGVAQNTLGGYERGERIPNADVIVSISKEFGIAYDWLLVGDGPMQSKQSPKSNHTPADTNIESCPRCAGLETELAELRQDLRKEREENRELVAENRTLWKENAEIRERAARLEGREEAQASSAPTKATRRSA